MLAQMRRALLAALLCLACESRQERRHLAIRVATVGALDPLVPGSDQRSFSALAQDWVFQPLLGVTDDGELAPKLASRFERIDGGHYRVQLPPGASFSDGSPVRDEDVITSLASADEGGLSVARRGEWLEIGARRPGAHVGVLLARVAVARKTAAGWIGTGPFAVVEQTPRRLLLRRMLPRPGHIDTVELKAFDSESDAFSRTLAGEAEILTNVPARMVEFFDGVPNLRIVRGRSPYAVGAVFNTRRLDRATRLALAVDLPLSGAAELAEREGCPSIVPPNAARQAPLPSGPPLRLIANVQDHTAQRLGLALRRWLGTRSSAFDVLEVSSILRERDRADLLLTRFLLQPRSNLAVHFQSNSPDNLMGYSNDEVDRAFDAGDIDRAEKAMAADPPVVYLCRPERIAVVDARFKNARLGPYGFFESLPEWEASP
jgi:MarR-like DNA-binding transcriptional regulator SgrR of sgrS sRNA